MNYELAKEWEKRFLKAHYEPIHSKGETCWCEPSSFARDGVQHIEHNEQRVVLKALYGEYISAIEAAMRELTSALREQLIDTKLVTAEQFNTELAPKLSELAMAVERNETGITARKYKISQ